MDGRSHEFLWRSLAHDRPPDAILAQEDATLGLTISTGPGEVSRLCPEIGHRPRMLVSLASSHAATLTSEGGVAGSDFPVEEGSKA